jgi:dTDP-4-amino-4,6-dideoxygalactose transaminase
MPVVPIALGALQREWSEIGSELQGAIDRVLKSGHFILGPEVATFEAEFAAYCGTAGAVGVGSGTDALTIALSAAGAGPGAEVVTTTLTSGATVTAIARAGATPVLVDIDPRTLNIDPKMVGDAITPRTRAIVPVHLYGRPADLGALRPLADGRAIFLVEDCAQSVGAKVGGNRTGSIGELGCFSFYPTKNLGAYGDGGMVTSSNPALLEQVRTLRTYGWRERDYSSTLGYNSRLDEIQAAVLKVKLRHVDAWNERRAHIAGLYSAGLAGIRGVSVPESADGHVWHLFVVRVANRTAVRQRLARNGIATGIHYPYPAHLQPAFAEFGRGQAFPHAEAACDEILSLPLFPQLTDDEVARVVETMREAVAR